MIICIPVNDNQGLSSTVCAHFGSAPLFMFVNTETGECRAKTNDNQHHDHGMCRPLAILEGESVEGLVVGGIGAGALAKLAASGIAVYAATHATVSQTVEAYKAGTLKKVEPHMACAQHGHGHQ